MKLNSLRNVRAAGVLVALAAGDALGAGYEFGAPLPAGALVTMKGGGPFGFAPAEWTDDTSMAIPIAEALLESVSDGGPPLRPSPRWSGRGLSGPPRRRTWGRRPAPSSLVRGGWLPLRAVRLKPRTSLQRPLTFMPGPAAVPATGL